MAQAVVTKLTRNRRRTVGGYATHAYNYGRVAGGPPPPHQSNKKERENISWRFAYTTFRELEKFWRSGKHGGKKAYIRNHELKGLVKYVVRLWWQEL